MAGRSRVRRRRGGWGKGFEKPQPRWGNGFEKVPTKWSIGFENLHALDAALAIEPPHQIARQRNGHARPGDARTPWTPGEDTPRADMYQLYRAADWTSPPAPVIAQAVTPTAASWCATDGGARPWKGCLRAGSRRGVQLARSGRGASEPRQLYLACEAAILAVVTRSSTTRKAIETQRDLFLGRGMHDPRDAPRGSLRTGGLKLIVRPPPATLGEVRRARSANRARTMSSIDRSCPPPRVALLHEAITPARRLLWRAPTRSNGAPHEATHSAACPARCTRVRAGRPHGARRRWPQPAPARRV